MDSIPNIKPMLCRELVGRNPEMQELLSWLQRAANGQPGVVVIAGEAGFGKSRLCRVFMEKSRENHALVLFGRAIRQTAALPFDPFLDAFRSYFVPSADASRLSAPILQAAFAPLVPLLPELAPLLPENTPMLHGGLQTPLQQQQALFQRVLSGLQSLVQAHHKPLLMVLEDLQWADETSLELLAFLAQRLSREAAAGAASPSLLIVGTLRTEALPERSALQRLLGQLHAQRQVSELHLTPLNAAEHRQCLTSILDQPVSEEFAAFLFAWDEGNPFFTEELVGAMAASGQLQMQHQRWLIPPSRKLQLPPSLTAAILERYVMLDSGDREVLDYAAVIGRTFDFPLLAALCRLDERELVEVLWRAVQAQLISEVSSALSGPLTTGKPERYQFRHALTREAIYDQMLAPERRLRHTDIAETLKQLTADIPENTTRSTKQVDVTGLLAEHYWQAGLFEKARPYALQEAERAGQIFAFHEEHYYLNIAQSSLPEDSPERLLLLQRLTILSLLVFDINRAFDWLAEVKLVSQHIGQPQRAALLMMRILLTSFLLLSAGPPMPNIVAEVETLAKAAFETSHDTAKDEDLLLASSLIAMYHSMDCRHRHVAMWVERCVALFRILAGPHKEEAILPGYLAKCWTKFHDNVTSAEDGFAEARNLLDVAHQKKQPEMILWGYAVLISGLISWGRTDEVERVLEEMSAYELRSETGRQTYLLGWHRFFSGEQWEQTIEQINNWVLRTTKLIEHTKLSTFAATDRVILAHFLLSRNSLAQAQEHLEAAQPTLEANNLYSYVSLAWWGLAKLYTLWGKLRRAEEWYERLFKRWKESEDTCLIIPIALDAITFYTNTGDLIKARRWLVELDHIARNTANPVAVAALWESQGVMRSKEGLLEQAIQALRQAVVLWDGLRRRYQQALASQCLAEILLIWAARRAMGRTERQAARAEAETLLNKAFAVYESLSILAKSAEVQVLRARTQLEAQRKRRSTLETHLLQNGLTQREMQILALLVAGRTNREIAAVLNISVGTVGIHVSHILTKLECATRTQAVSYALAKGWVSGVEET